MASVRKRKNKLASSTDCSQQIIRTAWQIAHLTLYEGSFHCCEDAIPRVVLDALKKSVAFCRLYRLKNNSGDLVTEAPVDLVTKARGATIQRYENERQQGHKKSPPPSATEMNETAKSPRLSGIRAQMASGPEFSIRHRVKPASCTNFYFFAPSIENARHIFGDLVIADKFARTIPVTLPRFASALTSQDAAYGNATFRNAWQLGAGNCHRSNLTMAARGGKLPPSRLNLYSKPPPSRERR
ncbi:hypothetical protein B0G73_109199 [Paraburkholderia sp. BL25I1N1]|nr:hypothetical protein B0G73_109199 [Paraburkholderia sp. BL25I1N1]